MHQPVMQLQDNPDNRDTHIVGITVDEKKCLPDTKNHKKRTSFTCGQKYVETYSSSDAVAQNPEERVQMKISRKRDNFKYYQNK